MSVLLHELMQNFEKRFGYAPGDNVVGRLESGVDHDALEELSRMGASRDLLDCDVIVIGSDGGGALFALGPSDGKIYNLHGGALVGSTYDVDDYGVEVVTDGFPQFLEFLRRNVIEALEEA